MTTQRGAAIFAAREMALTHIDQDLRKSLINNGAGRDSDWASVGQIVAASTARHFHPLEVLASKLAGSVDSTFDVGVFRDDMRNDVKSAYPCKE